jgi:TldD protein
MELVDDLKLFDNSLIKQLNSIAQNEILYWDIRASKTIGTILDFTDQKSKEVSYYDELDCGVRAFINGGWGFCVLKELDKSHILNAFEKATKLAKLSESKAIYRFNINEQPPNDISFKNSSKIPLEDVSVEEKFKLVQEQEKIAANYANEITNTHTIYVDSIANSLFINSFGSRIIQNLSFLRLHCMVYSKKKGLIQRSVNSVGGIGGFEVLTSEKANELSKKTAKEAVELLKAKSPKGGTFTIITDPKLTGTLIHEAFGHACEADSVLNRESILEGKINHKVAVDEVTIIDNPTFGQGKKFHLPYELYGCYNYDDEGIPSQSTTIIENGVLKNYLHSIETASRMGLTPNGHGRATGSSSKPLVRMGFIYLEPRDWKVHEIIEDTKHAILCEDFLYGYTNPATGNFQFKCKFSYEIENGEKKQLMRDVALSGIILEVLKKISAIGDKHSFNYSDGICGKAGQSVRVCDGGPYIRIDGITVGGLS